MTIKTLALLGLLAMLAAVKPAYAETFHTCAGFITSLPAVITTQGTWCLTKDLVTAVGTGEAITVNANNVTIDCNDFKIGGLAAGLGTTTSGIAAFNRLNVTVRHCNIRGFYYAIVLSGNGLGGGYTVEDNRLDGNTGSGIVVVGDGSVVRHNRVFDTGESTATTSVSGIFTWYAVDILDNTVSGVTAAAGSEGSATGIYTNLNPSGRILANGIRGLVPDGPGAALGIDNASSGRITLSENHVIGPGTIGLTCSSALARARDNVIGGFSAAIATCGDAGGNDITP